MKYPQLALNQRFGKLTVTSLRISQNKHTQWLNEFTCDCGSKLLRVPCVVFGKKPIRACYICSRLKAPGVTTNRELYNICIRAARDRELEFLLTIEEHSNLIKQNCYCCGKAPEPYNRYLTVSGERRKAAKGALQRAVDRAWILANGVDRIDSNKGYTLDNSAACCYDCNIAKAEKTLSEYIEHCRRVLSHQGRAA